MVYVPKDIKLPEPAPQPELTQPAAPVTRSKKKASQHVQCFKTRHSRAKGGFYAKKSADMMKIL